MSRNRNPDRAITLIELLISIALLALVIAGFFGVELFSRYHLLTSDRRAKLQNEASYLIEHMSKHLLTAMGDYDNPAVAITDTGAGSFYLDATVDSNNNGIREDGIDTRIRYCYSNGDCNIPSQPRAVLFQRGTDAGELLVRHVMALNVTLDSSETNLLEVDLTSCWDPSAATAACGSSQNPSISMRTKIRLPSVSIN